jgi:hypothetical protein
MLKNFSALASIAGLGQIAFRNKLINGEVTRVNQREFGGDWSTLSNGDYGYDRWKREDASNITQIIEENNFKPSTVHTISGNNVTTAQITSPASGNWTITVPNTATNVQVEEGTIVTPFEIISNQTILALCQRYYLRIKPGASRVFGPSYNGATSIGYAQVQFLVPLRVRPTTLEQSGTAGHYGIIQGTGASVALSSVPAFNSNTSNFVAAINATTGSGLTAASGSWFRAISAEAYLGWSAEL